MPTRTKVVARPPKRLTPDERELLLARHEGLVKAIAAKWKRSYPQLELEDLASEIRLGFVIAANRFDTSIGRPFIAYACRWARGCVRMFIQREVASGTRVPRLHGTVFVNIARLTVDDAIPERVNHESEVPVDFWPRVEQILGERLTRVVQMRFCNELPLNACAKELGVSRRRIQQLQQDALKRLRASLI
jgi:RNA polymerase sigma factor (sigma-70 family)